MPDRIEEIMKKFHIYLANCKESVYSSEDVIVSKKRIFSLLDELNKEVYDICEQYEATQEAKARGLMEAERQSAEIKEEAFDRAEDVYAASMTLAKDTIDRVKNSLEYTYIKVRREYEALLTSYDEKIKDLSDSAATITANLSELKEAETYLHMIENLKEKSKSAKDLKALQDEVRKEEIRSKVIGSVESVETLAVPEDGAETDPVDNTVSIQVHDAPKMAEISSKGKKKKDGFLKKLKTLAGGETIEVNEDSISENY